MNDKTVYNSMMKQASLYDLVDANPMFHPYETAGRIWNGLKTNNPGVLAKNTLSDMGTELRKLKDRIPNTGIGSDLMQDIADAPGNMMHNIWHADEILTGKRKPRLSRIDQRILDALKKLFGYGQAPATQELPKAASFNGAIKLAAAAGFAASSFFTA